MTTPTFARIDNFLEAPVADRVNPSRQALITVRPLSAARRCRGTEAASRTIARTPIPMHTSRITKGHARIRESVGREDDGPRKSC